MQEPRSFISSVADLFHRPQVLLGAVATVLFLGLSFAVTHRGFDQLREANRRISDAQNRQAAPSEYLQLSKDLAKTNLQVRRLAIFGAVLNLLLVLSAALLLARMIRRGEDRESVLDLEVSDQVKELAELTSHLLRVTELEKASLARELHDELGGLFVASKMDVSRLLRVLPVSESDIRQSLERISEVMDAGMNFKRRIVESLRPSLLDHLGLLVALRWMLQEAGDRSGIKCEAHFPDTEPVVSDDAGIAIYRIVQEAVTNALKYSEASVIAVRVVMEPSWLTVTIQDDGRGMQPVTTGRSSHGLINMRYRAKSLGGTCVVSSVLGTGTLVTLRSPQVSR